MGDHPNTYRGPDWPISVKADVAAYHADVCDCGNEPARCVRFPHAELAYRAGKRTGERLMKERR